MIYALITKTEEGETTFKTVFESKSDKKAKKRVVQWTKALSSKYQLVLDIDIIRVGTSLNNPLQDLKNSWAAKFPKLTNDFIKQRV